MRTVEELIAETPVFADLDTEHLALIAGCARNEHVDANVLLVREGAPADRFFLIRRGQVALEVHGPAGGPLVIETVQDGDVVGWSWLFPPYRWHLDARTLQACELIAFDGGCLRGKAEADHELGYQLMRRFAASVIERLEELSAGGFGGLLFRAHEWANREQTLKSYELFARHVMPQFQGSLGPISGSNAWARENRRQVFGSTPEAVRRAFTDFGHAVPEEYRSRTIGARDT